MYECITHKCVRRACPFRLLDNESAVVALCSRETTYKLFHLRPVEHFAVTRFSSSNAREA